MLETLSRSWHFAKMSYRLLWEDKRLIVFPLIASLAAGLVLASFALPLWKSGQLTEWFELMDDEAASQGNVGLYITAFGFYFCNYFVIVFFNTGLIACVVKMINGEEGSVSYGLSFAVKRLPQIVGWAFVSAVVGVLLKALENSNKRGAALVVWLLGSAWSALTFFVVPVIVVDGVGPVEAFKRSMKTLKSTWGTALVGNFSMGFLGFLLMLPILIVAFLLFMLAAGSGSVASMVAVGVIAGILFMIGASATAAADAIFRTFLFAYATGRTIPKDLDTSGFSDAFRSRN